MFFKKFLALEDTHCYAPMEVATLFAKRKRGVAGFVCNSLYDIRLFYNPYARFLEGVIFEDVLSYFVFFALVKKVAYIPEMLYVVFERENSTMRFREDNTDISSLPKYQQSLAKLFKNLPIMPTSTTRITHLCVWQANSSILPKSIKPYQLLKQIYSKNSTEGLEKSSHQPRLFLSP
ncbi:hypothetical protein [uncultured Helicobacter sp.]|uniref:hypothetical protein n=1 Tax=uncultured Helicobacter sp. TaxID=175537 RepID=UPI00374EA57D